MFATAFQDALARNPLCVRKVGTTPLHYARGGCGPFLLRAGASVRIDAMMSWNALHYAALHGELELFRMALQEIKGDARTEDHWEALHLAAWQGHAPIVEPCPQPTQLWYH